MHRIFGSIDSHIASCSLALNNLYLHTRQSLRVRFTLRLSLRQNVRFGYYHRLSKNFHKIKNLFLKISRYLQKCCNLLIFKQL